MIRRLFTAAALSALSAVAAGCGGSSIPRLVDVAPLASFQLAKVGDTNYYTLQIKGASTDVHVSSMRLVPIRTSPNLHILLYYVQQKGGVAGFGETWTKHGITAFGAGYNQAVGLVSPDKAVISKDKITPLGVVVHFAGEGTSIWKGMDVTYTASGHTTTELIPERITLCADLHETTEACSEAK